MLWVINCCLRPTCGGVCRLRLRCMHRGRCTVLLGALLLHSSLVRALPWLMVLGSVLTLRKATILQRLLGPTARHMCN